MMRDTTFQTGCVKSREESSGDVVTRERITSGTQEDINAPVLLQSRATGYGAVSATAVYNEASEQSGAGLVSIDPLVPLSSLNPAKAALFAKVTMISGTIGSVFACLICAAFLGPRWSDMECCARPLKLWLVVYVLLQLSQIPVRLVFLGRLLSLEGTNSTGIQECIAAVTGSTAWKLCQSVSTFTCVWFVIGAIWLSNSPDCASCAPCLYWTCAAVFAQAFARIFLAFSLFHSLFPQGTMTRQSEVATPDQSLEVATPDMIDEHIVVARHSHCSAGGDSCAVCLEDYEAGAFLWELPCGHRFHRKCADQWLQRSKRCPLCMGTIDDTSTHRHIRDKRLAT